jgi:hypothetical protein
VTPAADRALEAIAALAAVTREGTLRALPPDDLKKVVQALHREAGRLTAIAYRAGLDDHVVRLAAIPAYLLGESGR